MVWELITSATEMNILAIFSMDVLTETEHTHGPEGVPNMSVNMSWMPEQAGI